METSTNTVCPVCTLFLRPGITLKQHLTSHPKQKVIEALVRISCGIENENPPTHQRLTNPPEINIPGTSESTPGPAQSSPTAVLVNQIPVAAPQNMQPNPGNHFFIYQQSMSTTSPHQPNVLNINPLNQQYVIPAVFNSQLMPYVYQQQQVIMSSNGIPPNIRALPPFELPNSTHIEPKECVNKKVTEVENSEEGKQEDTNKVKEVESRLETESEVIESEDSTPPSPVKKVEHLEEVSFEVEENDGLVINNVERDEEEDAFHGGDSYGDNRDAIDHEEYIETPLSGSTEWGYHQEDDLSKSCQTQTLGSSSPRPVAEIEQEHLVENIEDGHQEQPEYFYFDHHHEADHNMLDSRPFTTVEMVSATNTYEQSDPIYTSANILHGEHMDFVNMDDIDNMQVIIGNYSGAPVISPVENFENTRPERPGVLMTIGEVGAEKIHYSEQDVNIRSDEKMPPRGELSGQESMGGASDITWNQMHYQDNNSNSLAYGPESWEDSNSALGGCEANLPPLQSRIPPPETCDDSPTIIGYSGPPLNFKCSSCDEAFVSTKERKEHELQQHPEKAIRKSNIIGLDVNKKKTKKLTIKPKQQKKENNFDSLLTTGLKAEQCEANANQLETETDETKLDIKPEVPAVILPKPIQIKAVCATCEVVFCNKKALRVHQVQEHGAAPLRCHQCGTCGETFPNEYKYNDHLKTHPLECRMCGKLFYRRQNMQLHMKRHLGFKPFKCDMCPKSFVTKQKHDEHRNTHTGYAPIKCSLCDETFKRHSNLVQHRNRHHYNVKKKLRDYICYCGEIFHSSKKLAWHKEVHDPKPKACTQCSEKFVHITSLTRHMRRAHNAEYLPEDRTKQQVNSVCPICKGTFLRSSLDAHIKNHSGARPYSCNTCQKEFTTKWNLKLHRWTHASRTQKPFKCDQCRGAFIRETDYVAHMNSHRSVRPYTCNYCGAQFIRKYNCQRHVKEHENNKTFSCDVCGKSFHRSYYLKDHMRVHSGVRPFSCHICGKTSTTKSNHNKHVQIHHAREPVSTEN